MAINDIRDTDVFELVIAPAHDPTRAVSSAPVPFEPPSTGDETRSYILSAECTFPDSVPIVTILRVNARGEASIHLLQGNRAPHVLSLSAEVMQRLLAIYPIAAHDCSAAQEANRERRDTSHGMYWDA